MPLSLIEVIWKSRELESLIVKVEEKYLTLVQVPPPTTPLITPTTVLPKPLPPVTLIKKCGHLHQSISLLTDIFRTRIPYTLTQDLTQYTSGQAMRESNQ